MAREREIYRINLERLDAFFPDKELLSKKDVVRFTKRSEPTVKKLFKFNGNYISKASLASQLSS